MHTSPEKFREFVRARRARDENCRGQDEGSKGIDNLINNHAKA